jgi:hypothetical protein
MDIVPSLPDMFGGRVVAFSEASFMFFFHAIHNGFYLLTAVERTTRLALATICMEGRDSTVELRPRRTILRCMKATAPEKSWGRRQANGMETGGFAPPC